MKTENCIIASVFSLDGIISIDYAVCIDPDAWIAEMMSTGMSLWQVFMEVDENFYVVIAPFGHILDLPDIAAAIDSTGKMAIEDGGVSAFEKCIVPDAWVKEMKRYDR